MCGIVGYVGPRAALPILMEGLRRLEYRGYDSAGVAVIDAEGKLSLRKEEGKLSRLDERLARDTNPLVGGLGLGHTRWATHGPPTTINAHPHHDEAIQIALVHNGIIENYAPLREALRTRGHVFETETDTEVLAHLIEEALEEIAVGSGNKGNDASDSAGAATQFSEAVRIALRQVEGAYALAVISEFAPDTLVVARHFSPLVVGLGEDENFVASDIPALLGQTRSVLLLEDGEMATIRREGVTLSNLQGEAIEREPMEVKWDAAAAEKGGYEHFVRKEIDEQPRALTDTLRGRLDGDTIHLPELDGLDVDGISRLYLVACGTSFYAGLTAKILLERWARMPVEVSIASELRYGDPVLGPETLVVLITQSGETADTLAAMRMASDAGAPTLAITNTVGSSVTRGADRTLLLQVGPEIGVVATKTFTGQLALLTLLSAELGRRRGHFSAAQTAVLVRDLRALPELMARAMDEASDTAIREAAEALADRRSMFFIGRGLDYPIALEAALKLKEISYIHAEGYPAGELKHGPIAMLDPSIPVFAFASASPVYDKMVSNIEEVRARGAQVVMVATEGDTTAQRLADRVLYVPAIREELAPFVTAVPAQLFAYHVAVVLGRDVDQPRNLAKCVTVE